MKNDDDLLKELLDNVLAETKMMIAKDPTSEGRRLARQYALTEPGRRIRAMEDESSKK